MKLAFFIPDLRGGGAQRMVINMANEFARRGHHVDLLLAHKTGTYENLIGRDVNVVDFSKKRTVLALPRLLGYLKQNKPDIVLSALTHANITLLMAKVLSFQLKTKFVVSERNYFSIRNKSKGNKVFPALIKLLYPRADGIVGISKGVAQDLEKITGIKDRIQWIHNPVVTSELIEEANVKEIEKSKIPVIVTSGRLVAQKDYPTLLKAFAQLLEEKQAHLMILGQGELEEQTKQLARDLGINEHVTFKGFLDKPLQTMAMADLFVLSSRWEGFGNVVVEALLCGLPVVSTDCPAGPAEILEEGKYGTLVPVNDPAALARAMSDALDKPKNPEKQKQRAMDFTVEKICEQYETLFNQLIAHKT